MLTPEEEKFLEYWKHNREQEKNPYRQVLTGLPAGLTFAVALLAIFATGWYERAHMEAYSGSSPYIFIGAILLIILFIAIFARKHKWEMNEQRYIELTHKQNKETGEQYNAQPLQKTEE